MFKYTKAFSGFSTTDLKRAKQFYGKTLGLKVDETPEGLELHTTGNRPILIYQSLGSKPAKYTILNFLVDDIEPAVDSLAKNGVIMEQYDMETFKTDKKGIVRSDGSHSGPKAAAWFKDPDGHVLAIIQEE
jgi:catechol 2,3-dioxygenase-like lactoylglutathione lyase family enzyme